MGGVHLFWIWYRSARTCREDNRNALLITWVNVSKWVSKADQCITTILREGRQQSNQTCHLEVRWPHFYSLKNCFSRLFTQAQRGKSKHGLWLTPLPASLPGRYSFLKAYKRTLSDSKHCSGACTEEPFSGESIPLIFLKEILQSSSLLYVYGKCKHRWFRKRASQ